MVKLEIGESETMDTAVYIVEDEERHVLAVTANYDAAQQIEDYLLAFRGVDFVTVVPVKVCVNFEEWNEKVATP